jgi:hypothetical protein
MTEGASSPSSNEFWILDPIVRPPLIGQHLSMTIHSLTAKMSAEV